MPFTIGEEFIFSSAKEICHEVLVEAAVQEIAHMCLCRLALWLGALRKWPKTLIHNCCSGLIHHCCMHSRLTNLETSPTRQYCLSMCDICIRRMCMRICYVRYLYQEDVHEDLLCALSLSGGCAWGLAMCAIFIRRMCMRTCYVRYLYQEDVHEDLLCALSLSGGCEWGFVMCAIFIRRICMRTCYVRYLYQEDVHEDLLCALSLSGGCEWGFVMCAIFIRRIKLTPGTSTLQFAASFSCR